MRLPTWFSLVALASACAHHRAPVPSSESKFFGGAPASHDAVVVLDNPGFAVGYSDERRNPLWAAYRLFTVEPTTSDDRPGFRVDARTDSKVGTDCYTGSGYDRGHDAPNAAIASRYGREAQRATFLMSNVSPQRPTLNRGPWKTFEARVADEYANDLGTVFVISGPIFEDTPALLDCAIQVPAAFYKIVIDPERRNSSARILAIVMGQDDEGSCRTVSDFATPVDCIEQLTGLDFLSELDDRIEAKVESAPPDAAWDLDETLGARCPAGASVAAPDPKRVRLLESCRQR